MDHLIAPVASGLLSALFGALAAYVAMSNRQTRTETLIEALRSEVERHNSIVERTYKLESDMATSWRRHDELSERVDRLESERMRG